MSRDKSGRTPHHSTETTSRTDSPELEGGTPLPEEVTGRAAATSEDLTVLFGNGSAAHLDDGFRGGSDDDIEVDTIDDSDAGADSDEETPPM